MRLEDRGHLVQPRRVVWVNGELAQMICLSSHGSSWLAQPTLSDPPPLDRVNSTFQFVGSLAFGLAGGRAADEFQADTVTDWLRRLRDRGVARLWLDIPEAKPVTGRGGPVDEQMLAGFANAGRWSLAATGGPSNEIWHATWTVGDRAAPDRRIWSVRYEGAHADLVTPQRPDLLRARSHLTEALQAAQDFATRQQMEAWPAWFQAALAGDPEIPYHPDLLPAGYTTEAWQLAAMAVKAWVFGGMGSWNDVYLDDRQAEAEYEATSRNLYSALLRALLASVNSDIGSGPSGVAG
jgi:hypothetical protein